MEDLILRQRCEEIAESCDEGMFVADGVSRLPEIARIRMIGASHQDVPGALHVSRLASVVLIQVVHVFEIEARNGRVGSALQVIGEQLFEIRHCSAFRNLSSARLIHGPTEPGRQPSSRAISSVLSPP